MAQSVRGGGARRVDADTAGKPTDLSIRTGGDGSKFPTSSAILPSVPSLPLQEAVVTVEINGRETSISIRYQIEAKVAFENCQAQFQSHTLDDYLQACAQAANNYDVDALKEKITALRKQLKENQDDDLKRVHQLRLKVFESVLAEKAKPAPAFEDQPLVDTVLNSARQVGDALENVVGAFGSLFRRTAETPNTQSTQYTDTANSSALRPSPSHLQEQDRAMPAPVRVSLPVSFSPALAAPVKSNQPSDPPSTPRLGGLPTPRGGSVLVSYQGGLVAISAYEEDVCRGLNTPQVKKSFPPHLTFSVLAALRPEGEQKDWADIYFGRSVADGRRGASPFFGVKALLDFNSESGEFSAYIENGTGARIAYADAPAEKQQAARNLKEDLKQVYQRYSSAESVPAAPSIESTRRTSDTEASVVFPPRQSQPTAQPRRPSDRDKGRLSAVLNQLFPS